MSESVRLDGNYLPKLIDNMASPILSITGDGAYDKRNCYEKAYERGAIPLFPPPNTMPPSNEQNTKKSCLAGTR